MVSGQPQPAEPRAVEQRPDAEQPRVVVRDDGGRSRLTVFFRFLLAIPHLIVLALWWILALVIAVVSWFAILFTGRPVARDVQLQFIRYYTQVIAYLALATEPFPAFGGRDGYPIDIQVASDESQSRWKTLFRPILAVPALLLAFAFASFQLGGQVQTEGGQTQSSAGFSFGIIAAVAFLGWFASLARARMPSGLRDLAAYGVGYLAQFWAYVLLVTDRYPTSDPLYPAYPRTEVEHPVRIDVSDDLRRSRLTVFFRLLLWLPHFIWLMLWGLVAALALIANWFVTLVRGRPAGPLHRFLARYVRYWTHTSAFLYLVANPFPGFVGERGSYPIDLELPAPERQSRWKTAFRFFLAFPAFLVSQALSSAFFFVALFGWFTGVFVARMPEGLRNLGAMSLRYSGQTAAYLALLTDRYPYASPALERDQPGAAPAPGWTG